MNMPRFNLSWLYMFIAMTIAYLYFTSDDNAGVNRELTYTEFKDMVTKGYASKIIAYNDNTVDLFIKPEHVKDVFKDDYKKVGRSPSVHVEVGSIDSLDKFLEKAQEEGTTHRPDGDDEYALFCKLQDHGGRGYQTKGRSLREVFSLRLRILRSSFSRRGQGSPLQNGFCKATP